MTVYEGQRLFQVNSVCRLAFYHDCFKPSSAILEHQEGYAE